MESNSQIKINKIRPADCGWTEPSTFCNDLDNRVSELVKYLRDGEPNSSLSVEKAISLLEKKGFQRLEESAAALIRDPFTLKEGAYFGVFVNNGLIAEVLEEYHWETIPEITKPFAKINFRNKDRTYLNSNCFCGIPKVLNKSAFN